MYLFFPSISAAELFKDCDHISSDSNYRPLKEYFLTDDEVHDLCLRLNSHEFLYTTDRNFFYCKSAKGASLTCAENEQGSWYPDLNVVKKFSSAKGKQFVLFKTQRLSHGIYGEGYHAFFLIPKSVNQRGYTVFSFPNVGASNGSYSDSGEVCSNINPDTEAITPMNPPFEILSENQSNVAIRFNQEITNCKTGQKSKQIMEFTWQTGRFEQTLNHIEKLPSEHQ